MAKKNSSSRKPADDSVMGSETVEREAEDSPSETPLTYANVSPAEDVPAAKPGKAKAAEDPATGSVGLGDIRKAVAFANSVGGLDKAMALLQIVKVAKEVQ